MTKKSTKSSSKTTNNIEKLAVLGAGIAGVATTAYFFLGPKAKKHQRVAKAWAIKMKGDVIEKLESARDVSEDTYNDIIDSVARQYEKKKKFGQDEINALADDLKKHWKNISKEVGIDKK